MKKQKAKAKKGGWFYKIRGSYLPYSWQGFVIYFVYLVYIVTLPAVWYFDGHEAWRLLAFVIPLICGAALLTQYVASKTSR